MENEDDQSVGDFLGSVVIADVMRDRRRETVVIDAASDVRQAFRTLIENQVHAAPVVSESVVRGVLSLNDMVRFVVAVMSGDGGGQLDLESVLERGKRHEWTPVAAEATLKQLVRRLSATHRLPLHDGGIVSQTDVVAFLACHAARLGELADQPLPQERWRKPVVSVELGDKLLKAFEVMAAAGVSGIAVVDGQGRLAETISSSDLRFSVEDALERLEEPVARFVPQGRQIVSANVNTSLRDLLLMLNEVSRVFVIDEQRRPIGVISKGDVLAALI